MAEGFVSQEHQLVFELDQLLEANFKKMTSPGFYARSFGLSLSMLNKICVKHRGQPMSGVIADRIISEAKLLLAETTLPASSIAYELGFKDPSYFCRYFKRVTGMTVMGYRRTTC